MGIQDLLQGANELVGVDGAVAVEEIATAADSPTRRRLSLVENSATDVREEF